MADQAGHRRIRDLAMPLRDGTILRADLTLPAGDGPHPALHCRTPYGKGADPEELAFAARAAARGYAVLIQDVRGRHASDGVFDPHVHEGRDGFDSIEWTAAQSWCDGRVGTFGLSYAGCVQWLAAALSPPHLLAMAPAMSYARLRDCIFYGGVFDADWLPWAFIVMAPDARRRLGLPGAQSVAEAAAEWERRKAELQDRLPLSAVAYLPELAEAAPFYARWLATPPWSRAWDFGDLDGAYPRVRAAVLHVDGWHDDAYGPKGAIANHAGLCASRRGHKDARSELVLGPWGHGIQAITGAEPRGARDFGPQAYLDYHGLVLDFMDRHVRGVDAPSPSPRPAPVRYFVMGANQWREAETWPPQSRPLALYLDAGGGLTPELPASEAATCFANDPADPVREEAAWALGPEDQRSLAELAGQTGQAGQAGRLAVFETPPLEAGLTIAGRIRAEIWLCADAPDLDLYVKLQDVASDGTAWPLMDTGAEVLRASLRGPQRGPESDPHAGPHAEPRPLTPGQAVRLDLDSLLTANAFAPGHRIRVVLCASWHPGLARNLQTGESEATHSATRPARITLLHGPKHPSRLVLPETA